VTAKSYIVDYQPVFVSKYLINLPKEDDLMKIIEEEQNKAQP
jgi:hypothetical protein